MESRQGVLIKNQKELTSLVSHTNKISDYLWKDSPVINADEGETLVYVDGLNIKSNPKKWNLYIAKEFSSPEKDGMPFIVKRDGRSIVIEEIKLSDLINLDSSLKNESKESVTLNRPIKESLDKARESLAEAIGKSLDTAFESAKGNFRPKKDMFNMNHSVWVSPSSAPQINLTEEQKNKLLNYIGVQKEGGLNLSPDKTIEENKEAFKKWLADTYHGRVIEDTRSRLHVTMFKHEINSHNVSLYIEDTSIDIPSFLVVSQEEVEGGFLTILKEEGDIKSDENTFKVGSIFSMSSDSRLARAQVKRTEVIA